MSTFILIHGAWHGAWCWHKITPLLESGGHTVVTPDLPALGVDRTPVQSITLQSYAERVCETLDACDEPVYLVGHSMGGAVITQAAEAMPQKVKLLVYLTAFLLPDGSSISDETQTDTDAALISSVVLSADGSLVTVRPDALQDVFYANCSPSDVALARSLLVPQPALPNATAVHTTADRWGAIPRAYIECTADRAISLAKQRAMHGRLPCQRVLTMASDHSPFLSDPQTLANHLLSL